MEFLSSSRHSLDLNAVPSHLLDDLKALFHYFEGEGFFAVGFCCYFE